MIASLNLIDNRWSADCFTCKQTRLAPHYSFEQLAEWVDRHNSEKHNRF